MAADHINEPESLFLDALYCEEEEGDDEVAKWAEFEDESKSGITLTKNKTIKHSLVPPLLFECDFFWDEEELQSLFSRERETSLKSNRTRFSSCLSLARKQGVEFILSISSYHGFSASASILAVDFLDRFLFDYANDFQTWLVQLVAIASLSLAAKVEENHVPLLVDLQVDDAKYLFEAKTIQRMELLILSALKWRMNPVTPLSFIDHIVRRLGLKSYVIYFEFLRSCENLLLSVISDSRLLGYFPSVLATATMLHVVHQDEYCAGNAVECENTMLDVLKISKVEVDECYGVILNVVSSRSKKSPSKRKKLELTSSGSNVVIINDAVTNSDSCSNDSWEVESSTSTPRLHLKKTRVEPHQINH